jgi:hypothetical protein
VQRLYLDVGMVDAVKDLTYALQDDAYVGDGIASALQGLLFDFRVWGGANLTTKLYLLETVQLLSIDTRARDQLYVSIGVCIHLRFNYNKGGCFQLPDGMLMACHGVARERGLHL